jgi:hypothetical protein
MRYILFTYDQYYPGGGANDIHSISNNVQVCINTFMKLRENDWSVLGHVYDTHDNVIVWDDSSLDVYK